MFDIVQTYTSTVMCLCGCLQWTLLFWGDLTKPSIAIASVDGFYLNLVVCLQLDIALLVQYLSFQYSVAYCSHLSLVHR